MKDERVKELADWICVSPYRHQSAMEIIRTAYAEGMRDAAEICGDVMLVCCGAPKRDECCGDPIPEMMTAEQCAAAIRAEAEGK